MEQRTRVPSFCDVIRLGVNISARKGDRASEAACLTGGATPSHGARTYVNSHMTTNAVRYMQSKLCSSSERDSLYVIHESETA